LASGSRHLLGSPDIFVFAGIRKIKIKDQRKKLKKVEKG
jgi:hypothetical protein